MYNLAFSKNTYSKIIFSLYDRILLTFVLPLIWKCNKKSIEIFYKENISLKHLDVGAGTGYFIKRCEQPPEDFKLSIMDINPVCMKTCSSQLAQFNPDIQNQDILKPVVTKEKFNSVGLNLLLHCLPGGMNEKGIAFKNISGVLNPGGTVFGTTFIVQNTKPDFLTRLWTYVFNLSGLLNNQEDTIEDLKSILERYYCESTIKIIGHCVFFTAKSKL